MWKKNQNGKAASKRQLPGGTKEVGEFVHAFMGYSFIKLDLSMNQT
ncbi:hypothetical protein [Bacillus toyonensis]|nr:hypothetical protein [Bacillus toyonensis]